MERILESSLPTRREVMEAFASLRAAVNEADARMERVESMMNTVMGSQLKLVESQLRVEALLQAVVANTAPAVVERDVEPRKITVGWVVRGKATQYSLGPNSPLVVNDRNKAFVFESKAEAYRDQRLWGEGSHMTVVRVYRRTRVKP